MTKVFTRTLLIAGSAALMTTACTQEGGADEDATDDAAAEDAAEATGDDAAPADEGPVENVTFDIDAITCWELSTAEEEDQSYIATIVYGYAAGVSGTNSQSSETMAATITGAVEYCNENPDETVLSAIQEGTG